MALTQSQQGATEAAAAHLVDADKRLAERRAYCTGVGRDESEAATELEELHLLAARGHISYAGGDRAAARAAYEKYCAEFAQRSQGCRLPSCLEAGACLKLARLLLDAGEAGQVLALCIRLLQHQQQGQGDSPTAAPSPHAGNPYLWITLAEASYTLASGETRAETRKAGLDQAEEALAKASCLDHSEPTAWGHLAMLSLLRAQGAASVADRDQLVLEAKQAFNNSLALHVTDENLLKYRSNSSLPLGLPPSFSPSLHRPPSPCHSSHFSPWTLACLSLPPLCAVLSC